MRLKIVVYVLGALLLATSAFGFNGQRQGFVLGGGLGLSPASKWEVDKIIGFEVNGAEETNAGVGLHLVIGYAWDNYNMIVYEGNGTGYDSDFFNQTMTQTFNGASWYHYYGEMGKAAFTTVGLGLYGFDGENLSANDPGIGLLLGGGYEFTRHWQFGAYIGFGKTSDAGVDFSHATFNILISGIAF